MLLGLRWTNGKAVTYDRRPVYLTGSGVLFFFFLNYIKPYIRDFLIRSKPKLKMHHEAKANICALFKLPPEHDLIRQTDECVYQLACSIYFEEHADVYLKLDAIVNQALRLQLEACDPI